MGFVDLSAASSPGVVTLQAKPPSSSGQGGCGSGGADGQAGPVGSVAEEESAAFVSKNVSALQTVEGFLDSLTNSSR